MRRPRSRSPRRRGIWHGRFFLYYLLMNATADEANVTVRYLRPFPLPPIDKSYIVPANGRLTIWVNQQDPALSATDVSAVITSDRPIVVERAMYSNAGGVVWSAGTNAVATKLQ